MTWTLLVKVDDVEAYTIKDLSYTQGQKLIEKVIKHKDSSAIDCYLIPTVSIEDLDE